MGIHQDISKHVLIDLNSLVIDIKKSNGSWFVDLVNGKKYLDMFSQFSSQPLGWNHPKLTVYKEKLGEIAINKIANSDILSEVYHEFVNSVASITPDFIHHFYIESSGTLAVENALKAAFDWKAKIDNLKDRYDDMKIICFKGCFHGRGGYNLSLTSSYDPAKTALYPKFNWYKVYSPHIRNYPINDIEVSNDELQSLSEIKKHLSTGLIAAIIIEPIQGEGGNNEYRNEFFKELRQLCNEYNTMLIFDEVQTFASTGSWWAYQSTGIIPDIICFAKKMQVGGICCTDRIDLVKDNVFKVHSRINSTFGGDYCSMARASIIIDIIKEDNLLENSRITGEYFLEQLKTLGLKNVRGKGCLLAFDLESSKERKEILEKLNQNMIVLPCGGKSIRFRPHLTVSKDDIDVAINIIKGCL